MLISMITWNKLSEAQQAIIQEAAAEAIAWQRKLAEQEDEEFWNKIKETGKMSVITVDRQPFIDATKDVYEKMAKTVGQENIDKVKAMENQ